MIRRPARDRTSTSGPTPARCVTGRRLNATWSVGGAIKLLHNHTALADTAVTIGSSATKAEYTLGILGSPVANCTAGLMITQAPAWIETKVSTATGSEKERSTTLLTRVRTSLGWRPRPDAAIYTDLQYLRIRSDDDRANFLRVMLLGEKLITPTIPLRFRVTAETAGQVTPTLGVGMYGIKGANVELYYSYNAYPEVRRELGITNYWMLVMSKMF